MTMMMEDGIICICRENICSGYGLLQPGKQDDGTHSQSGFKVSTLVLLSVLTRPHTQPPAVHHPVTDAVTFDLPNTDSRPRQRAELTGS